MKFLKSKKAIEQGAESFRKIVNDEKTQVLAVVGTVKDLMTMGILEECNAAPDMWCCLSDIVTEECAGFGRTREEAIDRANNGLGIGK